MSDKKTRTIDVNYIARVEGEGALSLDIEGDAVTNVQLKIFEPPRFFEALLRGRDFKEAPDITARICGICPIAYQMSAIQAMESLLDIQVDPQVQQLRRMIYCGEWIESHSLHMHMLHAPDFLGFPDAIQMAKQHRKEVERGLRIKKAGNSLVECLGGRSIHPINMRVGGFYRLPEAAELKALRDEIQWAIDASVETVHWAAQFEYPDYEQEYECIALSHPEQYAIECGSVVSSQGAAFTAERFEEYIEEFQVPYSTALHARLKGRGSYLVGPMARYNLNYAQLPASIKGLAEEVGLGSTCTNPFKSILVRGLEVLYAFEEALRIIDQYEKPTTDAPQISPCQGVGYGCTEAPRGILYHRYEVDDHGAIKVAQIVPPTSQNQPTIEQDLKRFIADYTALDDDALGDKCEAFIRNYDPCISCSAHFLKLKTNRR